MQTPEQLYQEYRDREAKSFRVYSVLTQKFTDSDSLKSVVDEFQRYEILAEMFKDVISKNKSSV